MLALNPLRLSNWQQTIEKIARKLANWSFRTLNFVGRAVLVKAVLQSIPMYQLSAMAAPKGACAKMVEIFKKFIWGGLKDQRKWSLISWKDLVKSKTEGGLGLRDPYMLNQVMGAKLWWRWMNGGNDLWKRIWTKKYNMPTKPEEILRISDTPKGLTIWNLASQNKEIITKHAFWEIRDGSSARFWEEAW